MTAKEKAKQLVENMFNVDLKCDNEAMCMLYPHAIKCALIAVDEVLSEYVKGFNKMKQLHPYMLDAMQSEGYKYWQEVKHEIEKL